MAFYVPNKHETGNLVELEAAMLPVSSESAVWECVNIGSCVVSLDLKLSTYMGLQLEEATEDLSCKNMVLPDCGVFQPLG